MGIVNLTPDSFSDGRGVVKSTAWASRRALSLLAAGADFIDFGAESTRPGAQAIAPDQEIERLGEVVKRVRSRTDAPLSVDTYHAATAAYVLDQGADMINDVTALRQDWEGEAGTGGDGEMARLVARHKAHVVLMHMPASPARMQEHPVYQDVCRQVWDFLRAAATYAEGEGIPRERIWLDPGFGFGKNFTHNRDLLAGLPGLARLGYPVLAGLSRKRLIQDALSLGVGERREASLTLAVLAAERGARCVRVHDVQATARAVGMLDALRLPEANP
ncbi:MAG: dihydropteroate synthase [Planctomycetota bacterium]|jgi:dihydropteroate synthase|nr:dihydropteroate synthase [Planctomycetota bacterium]